MESFESKTGMDVEAARLVFPAPAPITLTSLYTKMNGMAMVYFSIPLKIVNTMVHIAILCGIVLNLIGFLSIQESFFGEPLPSCVECI